MEVKKSPKADLQNKKGLFLQIGLIVALLITFFAFNYSQSEKEVQQIDMGVAQVEEDIMEITTQDQKPPEPPRQQTVVVTDILNIVRNDAVVSSNIDFTEFDEGDVVVQTAAVVEETAADEPFLIVEVYPKFQGGDLNTFRNWVTGRLRYPPIAAENGISGRVTVEFVIERDGSLTNVKVLQSPDRSLSEEAVRVLNTSPKWTPGRQRNAPVRVKYSMPINFTIQQ